MRTVIIVDDEPITRMDLAEMLAELDFTVLGEAGDGFDAIELCRARRPDVVLMDVKMPVFDGLTAAETIVADDLAECVVLLTAFGHGDIVERANRIGVTGYLVKPIEQRMLLPTIEVALAQSRRLRQSRREAEQARRQVEESKVIARAQGLLAKEMGVLRDAGLPGAAADGHGQAHHHRRPGRRLCGAAHPSAGGGPGKEPAAEAAADERVQRL